MVKQLGIPTWFMTLSCVDLRWPELFQIVARTQGRDITEEQIEALSYAERCQLLNANPVVTAKHFQHRVETFFREVLLSHINPIGKITYYALRIEFQMRGSPHLHALIWTSWCRRLLKNMNSLKPVEVEPIYLFLTGGGGAGKSHLIKTIYYTAVKTFRHPPFNPELPIVLLMAPTGVAAINIDGTTINTGLAIPKETNDNLPAMSDQRKTQYRLSLKDLKLIIVDEISMVGNTTLLHIHQRLRNFWMLIFHTLFAGISIIAVGDLYQLPPIKKKAVFDNYKIETHNLCHPWSVFKMIELTEIMRQAFTELFNRIRTASHTRR